MVMNTPYLKYCNKFNGIFKCGEKLSDDDSAWLDFGKMQVCYNKK